MTAPRLLLAALALYGLFVGYTMYVATCRVQESCWYDGKLHWWLR